MASKDASEDEFEDTYVYVEVSGLSDTSFLHSANGECKVLGLDSEKPVFEFGGQIFTGNYKDVLGTAVVFEEDEEKIRSGEGVEIIQSELDPEHSVQVQPLRFKCITNKKLHLFKGFLSEKGDGKDITGCAEVDLEDEEEADDDTTMEADADNADDADEKNEPDVESAVENMSVDQT
ncbi:general transcription factor 3C polypeptide 6-like [Lineus longissimus]|uniref:general transcription factor 3C polypeptide 6-like n=1 Tax=Lineus longissimus TaxID=88925 RepID=UPI002B4D2B38